MFPSSQGGRHMITVHSRDRLSWASLYAPHEVSIPLPFLRMSAYGPRLDHSVCCSNQYFVGPQPHAQEHSISVPIIELSQLSCCRLSRHAHHLLPKLCNRPRRSVASDVLHGRPALVVHAVSGDEIRRPLDQPRIQGMSFSNTHSQFGL